MGSLSYIENLFQKLLIKIMLLGYRPFHLWHYLLRCRVKKNTSKLPNFDPKFDSIREKILAKNKIIQEEYHHLFIPYYRFCPDCTTPCCLDSSQSTTYDELDALLYGIPREQIVRFSNGTRGILQKLVGKKNYLTNPNGKSRHNLAPCVDLRENSCRFPWGKRVVMCVMKLCVPFVAHMS